MSLKKVYLISSVIYIAVMAAMWDIWWHQAIGPDFFWLPPHILLYISVAVAIVVAISAWRENRNQLLRNLILTLSAIPILKFVDNIWHGVFGIENPESPLPIIFWSPPHLAMAAAFILSARAVLPIIQSEKNPATKQLFSGLMLGAIITGFMFAVTPLQPFGPYHDFSYAYFGPWSAGIIAAVFIGCLFFSERFMPGIGKATMATIFFLILMSVVGMGQAWGGGLILNAHQATPGWIITFAYLGAAVVFDIMRKANTLLRGAVTGAVWGGLFLIPAALVYKNIFAENFNYDFFAAVAIPIFAAILGGTAISAVSLIKSTAVKAQPKHGL